MAGQHGIEVAPAPGLPERLGGAPLDLVKATAALLMVVDHVNTILLNGAVTAMWRFGRISFPLFCFVLACHLVRGADPGRYARVLLLAGLATQPIYAAAFPYGTSEANILFTLAAGTALAAALLDARAPLQHAALALGLAAVFALPRFAKTGVDYGLAGILLPAVLALALRHPRRHLLWLAPALFAVNYASWKPKGETPLVGAGLDFAFAALGGALVIALAAACAGRPRFLPRYALHVFYPGHLLVLALLRVAGAP